MIWLFLIILIVLLIIFFVCTLILAGNEDEYIEYNINSGQ